MQRIHIDHWKNLRWFIWSNFQVTASSYWLHGSEEVSAKTTAICLAVCTGGEASGDQAHTLLPDALWESVVQQPSVEELECTVSSSDDRHWKQLQWHEGKVCAACHCWRWCLKNTGVELTSSVCVSSQQDDRERVQTGLWLHYSGCGCVWGEAAPLSVPTNWRLQWHSRHHLSCQQPEQTPTIHLGRTAWTTVPTLPWSGDYSERKSELRWEKGRKWTVFCVFCDCCLDMTVF